MTSSTFDHSARISERHARQRESRVDRWWNAYGAILGLLAWGMLMAHVVWGMVT